MVEDNPVNMMIAVAMLERWGVRGRRRPSDGREAVDAVHAPRAAGRPFDAVLMDVQMPVMSGHEATRALRASVGRAQLPIIALTAAALVTRARRGAGRRHERLPHQADRRQAPAPRCCAGPARGAADGQAQASPV